MKCWGFKQKFLCKFLPKTFYLLVIILAILATGYAAGTNKQVTVGIIQFIEHPALDSEREAIIKTLEKAGYEKGRNLTLIYQNAQGNVGTCAQIASQIASQMPDVVVAIATPAAQASLKELTKNNIPMVFTAVTSPVEAKLVTSLDGQDPKSLVTGVSDYLSGEVQLAFVKKYVKGLRVLGILYNPGEPNSVAQIVELEKAADREHIKLEFSPASKTAEVATAAQALVGKDVDAIHVINDNTVAAAIRSVAMVAEKGKKPLFVADIDLIEMGAVAAIGFNREQLGASAGEMVVKILKGTSPASIPVLRNHKTTEAVNKRAAETIGFKLL